MARPPARIGGKARNLGSTHYVVEIQGANALSEHFWALSQMWDPFAQGLLEVVGEIGIEVARENVPVRTGATRDSINMAPGVMPFEGTGYMIEVGPTTFYSPFLEYGTIKMAPRPFMVIAGDAMEVLTVNSVIEFLKLVDTETGGSGFGGGAGVGGKGLGRVMSDPRVRNPFSRHRTFLYSGSRFLGDIAVFGGREVLGPVRASMLGMAKSLGDIGSIMNATLTTRITNRLRGRAVGRLTGFGSASLSHAKAYSGFPGGEGGHRVYQRAVGKFGTNVGFSSMSLGRFGL